MSQIMDNWWVRLANYGQLVGQACLRTLTPTLHKLVSVEKEFPISCDEGFPH